MKTYTKDQLKELIMQFIEQALKGEDQSYAQYKVIYEGYATSAGFGYGRYASVPGFVLLGKGQTSQKGIYPCLLLYRQYSINDDGDWIKPKSLVSCPLVVSYGISQTNPPDRDWNVSGKKQIKELSNIKDIKYGESYIEEVYNVSLSNIPIDKIIDSLDIVIEKYKEVIPCNNQCIPEETTSSTREHKAPQLMIGETDIIALLQANHNIILHGAPGTGKTYLAKEIAKAMCGDNVKDIKELENSRQFKMVQFHPSYDYTDFVEGLRPTGTDNNGNIIFARQDGVFKKFCKEAVKTKDKDFIFVLDEINRGDMSKIFGELFYAIDPGYRGEKGKIDTQYQNLIPKEGNKNFYENNADPFRYGFFVPDNVYIIGTMNDIDRSVESMDFAMRRRFQFIEVTAKDSAKNMNIEGEAQKRMEALNKCIVSDKIDLSSAFQIGGSYFLGKDDKPLPDTYNFENLWKYRLEGLLREYLRGEEEHSAKEKMEILEKAFNFEYLFKDTEQEPIQNIQNEGNTPDNSNE